MSPAPQSPPHSKPNSPTKVTSNETSNPRLVTKSPATPASSAAEPHRYVRTLLLSWQALQSRDPAELRNRAVQMVAEIPIRAWVELGGDRIGGREAGHRNSTNSTKLGPPGRGQRWQTRCRPVCGSFRQADVTGFLLVEVRRRRTWAAKSLVTALRSLLDVSHVAGHVPADWARRCRRWPVGV